MVSKIPATVFTQYLTVILNSIHDIVLLIDIEPAGGSGSGRYRMIMANDSFFGELGYPRDCIGRTVDELTKPDAYNRLVAHYQKVINDKKPLKYTEWYSLPTGKRLLETTMIPIFNAVGECVQIAVITHDVTEIHHMREQQKEAAETLESIAFNLRTL